MQTTDNYLTKDNSEASLSLYPLGLLSCVPAPFSAHSHLLLVTAPSSAKEGTYFPSSANKIPGNVSPLP